MNAETETTSRVCDILVVAGVARLTGATPAQVRRAIRAGHLPAWRPGGRYLIHVNNAEKWGAERRSREPA